MSDQRADRQNSSDSTIVIIAVAAAILVGLCMAAVCVFAALFLLLPLSQPLSTRPSGTAEECPFLTDVIVFEDTDGDQFRDSGEPGVKDVGIWVTANSQPHVVGITDSDGLVQVDWRSADCVSAIYADLPPGYQATTDTVFGPYGVSARRSAPLYIGLTKLP